MNYVISNRGDAALSAYVEVDLWQEPSWALDHDYAIHQGSTEGQQSNS